ncbi:MAG: hypothetical protein AAB434_03655 [Planctomycetota bacterium]
MTLALLLAAIAQVQTLFVEVCPERDGNDDLCRTEERTRAVVLIHGLKAHPFSEDRVRKPKLDDWQEEDSDLVEELGKESDVFAFCYGQDAALEAIGAQPDLPDAVGRLRKLGYTQIVLVGHSAGGLLARQAVEDHPDCGATKVIQVCSPNTGAALGKLANGVREAQEPFVKSLCKEARKAILEGRADKRIPDGVEFVCIVGDGGGAGDFVVSDDSQWPQDLQDQGVPAIQLVTMHFTAMRSDRIGRKIAELVRDDQPRWSQEKVVSARKEMLNR